jgi:hypothetical protein
VEPLLRNGHGLSNIPGQLLGNNSKQTSLHSNESTRNNKGTAGNGVFVRWSVPSKEDNWGNQVSSVQESEGKSQRQLVKEQLEESWTGAAIQRGLERRS